MNSYAPNMDVRIQYFDENQGVRIIDAYDARSTQKNLSNEDANLKEWILEIDEENEIIKFSNAKKTSFEDSDFPSKKINETLVPAVLSYLIGNSKNEVNYLNYDKNRKRVIEFFDQVPTDRKKTAEKEMLRWKERVQYEPINGLYQSMTFLNGFRGVTKDGLIAVFLTSMFDYVFPSLFLYHSIVFFVGLIFHRHFLYLFDLLNEKIGDRFEFLVVPRWRLFQEFSIGNPFYVIFQKPKDLDFDAFNTYLPLMSLCVGANEKKKELINVRRNIYSHTPSSTFEFIVRHFKEDLSCVFQETKTINFEIKNESPRADGIYEEIVTESVDENSAIAKY